MSAASTHDTWRPSDTPEQRRIQWLEALLSLAREELAQLRHERDMLLADAERLRAELDEATGVIR